MILHIDMDAFYASIEIRDNPDLIGRPVVVGGSAEGRGVIAAASYEARKYGLHSAMPAAIAVRRCPQAVFVKPRMQHYANVSRQIREIFFRFTSLVEPLALDEAFLDVSGCRRIFGDAPTIAQSIKEQIDERLGLTASAGVAPNKFLAKIASDLNKPDGLTCVAPDAVLEFLQPLEISRVWGVGPKTQAKLTRKGIHTIGQLQHLNENTMQTLFGNSADHFYRLCRGIDARPVIPDRSAKSISRETTFPEDLSDPQALLAWLHELTDQVARRLRNSQLRGRVVMVKIRDQNFNTFVRSRTLGQATFSTQEIWQSVQTLFNEFRQSNPSPVRLLGVGIKDLNGSKKTQQCLFDQSATNKNQQLEATSDLIREKFGDSALTNGSKLEHAVRLAKRSAGPPE